VEEGNGEDEGGKTGGQTLAMRVSDWCATLVVAMNLLRYIRCRDRVSLPRVTAKSLAPIGSGTHFGRL